MTEEFLPTGKPRQEVNMAKFDEFDDDIFNEDDELYDEMLMEDEFDDEFDDYDDSDDDFEDDDDFEEDEEGLDFLGMVQDEEGNWVYPEDLE